jgi:glycosyltransferase involved in cell wall biosynthesis
VLVVTRVRAHRAMIEAEGACVVALEANRKSLNPLAMLFTLYRLIRILRFHKVDMVHCIALRSIVMGGLAARLSGVSKRIYALTGLGFLGAQNTRTARMALHCLRTVIRRFLESQGTHYLFENPDDPLLLGLNPDAPCVTLVGGAGIDPAFFQPSPQPFSPPLKVAVVARMLWSKGIDVAVEAVTLARAPKEQGGHGANITLSLYGAPDPANPKAISETLLREWSMRPGISWHGAVQDVRPVWQTHHVACLPSRGGEGLPRTLLEAAACGRVLLTTNVPGCRTLVRDGVEGFILPVNDANAFAKALAALAQNGEHVSAMGHAARQRVLNGFTESDIMQALTQLYQKMLDEKKS